MPPTKDQLQAAYAEGMALQKAGKDDEALQKFAAIVDANPNIAEVHFQIARLFLKNDRLERALRHFKAAAMLRPAVPDIWSFWAEAVMALSDKEEQKAFTDALSKSKLDKRLKGDLATAVEFKGKFKVSIGPADPAAFQFILTSIGAGRLVEAEVTADAQIRKYPDVAALHDLRAVALSGQGRKPEAAQASEKATRLDPRNPEARVTYAQVLNDLQRAPEGVHQCNLALRISPGLTSALICRANCYYEMRFKSQAKADLARAIATNRKAETAYVELARRHYEDNEFFDAQDVLKKAEKAGLKSPALTLLNGLVLADLEQPEKALQQYERVASEAPETLLAHARIGELRQTLGDFDGAEAAFRQAMDLDPDRGETYRIYLTSKKLTLDDPLVAEMDARFKDDDLSPERRAHFGFALSKVMEDNKQYDRVFSYLRPANDMLREMVNYDMDRRIAHDQKLKDSMRTVDWQAAPMNDQSDFAPIFVTGMPRSGTTLVEQIIASHSSVTGAGEVGIAPKRALALFGDEEGRIMPADRVPRERYEGLASGYEDFMRRLYPKADRVTDKSIQTYGWIGPLKRAMPKARFVVVRRDPRDNLLSIYRNVFPDGAHLYAYSLTQLAQMYRLFVEYIELWRELAPDWFYEIQYEDLVSNPEEETRKLIDACGLTWEDACLNFHQSDRRVKTLSVYQVRQPMYKSSTKAWERYSDELSELFEALGQEVPDAAQ